MTELPCSYPECEERSTHLEFYWTGIPKPLCTEHAKLGLNDLAFEYGPDLTHQTVDEED